MMVMFIHNNLQYMNENDDNIPSIVHDHGYTYLQWHNNHTIDDNITTTLTRYPRFGILPYENNTDDVRTEKNLNFARSSVFSIKNYIFQLYEKNGSIFDRLAVQNCGTSEKLNSNQVLHYENDSDEVKKIIK